MRILFRKIPHHQEPKLRRTRVRGLNGDNYSTFHSVPWFTWHWNIYPIQLSVSEIGFNFQQQGIHGPEGNLKLLFPYKLLIEVGTRGHRGHVPPRFCNKQRSVFFILENAPFFVRKKCPRSVVPLSLRCFLHPWNSLPAFCKFPESKRWVILPRFYQPIFSHLS